MKFRYLVACAVALACCAPSHAADNKPLVAQKPIVIPGKGGGFDWMAVDGSMHRLFACHKGTGTVAVLDLETEKVLPSPATGAAQGIAVDFKDERVFVGDAEENKVVALDRKTLTKLGELDLGGPVDAMVFDYKRGMLYADNDDGTKVWVIDPKSLKVVDTVTIPEAPEYIEFDPQSDRVYQNIKSNNTVQVINPNTNKVEAVWSTEPATGPHGLALNRKTQRLFSAGKNGKLVVIDMKTGKCIATVDIGSGVDQIAFDPGNQRIYCSCKNMISVLQETADGAKLLGNVEAPKGSHTVAVNTKTHDVWTCYADAENSYFMKLSVP